MGIGLTMATHEIKTGSQKAGLQGSLSRVQTVQRLWLVQVQKPLPKHGNQSGHYQLGGGVAVLTNNRRVDAATPCRGSSVSIHLILAFTAEAKEAVGDFDFVSRIPSRSVFGGVVTWAPRF
jgi:hypothetical protein